MSQAQWRLVKGLFAMSRLPAALLALSTLAACASTGQSAATGAGAQRGLDRHAREAISHEDMLTQMAFWAGEYNTFPNDIEAARRFSEALRKGGQAERAAQVAGEALSRFPNDTALLYTYGLAQVGARKPQEALRPLALVASADENNWHARSALGAALDLLGRFGEARAAYREALVIAPNNAGVLTNLGVSHLMAGEPEAAEPILRQAAALSDAPAEARQNLALALMLMGRFDEGEQLQRADLPPALAAENEAYVRALLGDSRRWGDLRR